MKRVFLCAFVAAVCARGETLEQATARVTAAIEARHLPFDTILDPIYDAPDSNRVVAYTRCGDSAIWTGHWLAAESYRYRMTVSAEGLANVRRALSGIERLVSVTGGRGLARCAVPVSWAFTAGIRNEEKGNNEHSATIGGEPWIWFGRTSRDQYIGVLFGLSVAFQHVEVEDVRARVTAVATQIIEPLLDNNWSVVPPGEDTSTTFAFRPEQQAAILQIAKQVNPARFARAYDSWRPGLLGFGLGVNLDAMDPHGSYYKFNLDALSFDRLLKLEPPGSARTPEYWGTYEQFRRTVSAHGNAFFDLVDRGVRGPDGKRDAGIVQMLVDLLARPNRDFWVDLRGKVPECGGDRACNPIPVRDRVLSDFVWQRSPFQLYGGGSGRVENAGLDLVLPYWMARYYAVTSPIAVVSAAHGGLGLAPASIASAYGTNLGDIRAVAVQDAAGVERDARVFAITPSQINFEIPEQSATGTAVVSFIRADGSRVQSGVDLHRVAPAIFTGLQNGEGAAAAIAWRTGTGVALVKCVGPLLCISEPARTGEWVSLFATGVRGRSSLGAVRVSAGGLVLQVTYAGAQGEFFGLDQVNFQIPPELKAAGEQELILTVDGVASNRVRLRIE